MGTLKTYDSTYDGTEVDENNLEALLGCSPTEFLAFTGIFGLNVSKLDQVVIEGQYPVILIIINCDKVELEVSISLKSMRVHDELIRSKNKEKGVGWGLIQSQVEALRAENFLSITLEAADGFDDGGRPYDGYKVWQKMGFFMTLQSQEKFEQVMAKHKRTEKTIHELYKSADGPGFWEKNGFAWDGKFDLAEGSESNAILENYLNNKKT